MSKTKSRKQSRSKTSVLNMGSVYDLKLVLYLIIGTQWLYISNAESASPIPIPIGAVIGFFFIQHEHFQIDRKIEYSILLTAMFIGFWLPMGINFVK